MRKYIGYIPAVVFTVLYCVVGFGGFGGVMSEAFLWTLCFWISALLLHKGFFWGGVFGLLPAINMIYLGTLQNGQVIDVEIPIGIGLIVFYAVFGFYLRKNRDTAPMVKNSEIILVIVRVLFTGVAFFISAYAAIISFMILSSEQINTVLSYIAMLVVPSLLVPLIWLKKKRRFVIAWLIIASIYFIALGVNYGMVRYDKSITINTSPNIRVQEYMPFKEETKIVKYNSKTLKLDGKLPKIDGAAALFPVYSAFVNATYPDTVKLEPDGPFQYNNTSVGYSLLAEKQTDIFIGVYPSQEQKAYAVENATTFKYTPIGTEAFVFFVHKDNPIENLTTEQIKSIYSGDITNWKQLGGKNEEIAAFQRNEGSGSQSMLKRFMGDKPIMDPPTELRNDLMSGIIEQVSNYKSKSNSIGFSFRYYVEGIIKNPDIKMLSVDGVAPTAENIKNGKYPVTTPIYAVTYEENKNENVDKLLNWILSDEGQYIIEETGYVGIAD